MKMICRRHFAGGSLFLLSYICYNKNMKELRSFIDICENALASKHYHCTVK